MTTAPTTMPNDPTSDPAQQHGALQAFLQFVKARFQGGAAAPGAAQMPSQMPTFGGSPAQVGGAPPQMTGPAAAPTAMPTARPTPQDGMPAPTASVPPSAMQSLPDYQSTKGSVGQRGSLINEVAKTITSFKANKDATAFAKAKNSLAMFQNALAQGDMQVANLLGSDPKIISSWDKYLKMEFPRMPGGDTAGKLGGVNQPGGIAVTQDVNANAAAQLAAQKQQVDIANVQSQTGEHTAGAALSIAQAGQVDAATAAAQHKLELDKRYDDAKAQADLRATDAKTRADIAKAAGDEAYAKAAPELLKMQSRSYNASAAESIARAHVLEHEVAAGGTPAELRANFTEARRDYGATLVNATRDLNSLKTFYQKIDKGSMTGAGARATGAWLGLMDSKASVKDQLDTAQATYDKMMKGFMWMAKQEEAVAGGKAKASDVLTKAYEMGGLAPASSGQARPTGAVSIGTKDGKDHYLDKDNKDLGPVG